MSGYVKREIAHSAFAVAVTVAVAVAGELAAVQSFDRTFWSGLAVTAARSLGTALVTVLSRYVSGYVASPQEE